MLQRNGTAVHSLASENLEELESLVDPARQKQEEIVVTALGSLYKGKVLYTLTYIGLTGHPFSRFRHLCVFLDIPCVFLADSDL
jgi:hypothetical protein